MARGGGRGAMHSIARAARSANTRSSGSKNRSRSAPSRRTNSNSCNKTGGRNRTLSGTSKSTNKTPRSASKSPFTNRSTSTWSNVSQYDTMLTGPMTGRSSSMNSTRSSKKENIQEAQIVPNVPNLDRTERSLLSAIENGSRRDSAASAKTEKSSKSGRSLSNEKSTKSGRSQRNESIDKSITSGRRHSAGKNDNSFSSPIRQERGRNLVRNRDLYEQRKNARTSGRSTSLPRTQTPHLDERDEQFENLRNTPADENREWNRRFPSGHVVVYTDASAYADRSGFGIYYGPNHELNRSERINEPPHSSYRAEVLAAIQALKNLREWDGYNDEPVILRTDAHLIDLAMKGEEGGPQWYRTQKELCREELVELREEAENFPNGVTFEHVYAHTDDPGNEAADDLARQATVGPQRSRSLSRDRSGEPARRRSLSNDEYHIRSHSAHVEGRRQ